jgi:xanthine dehydrogenase YagS FAD-binding subunit
MNPFDYLNASSLEAAQARLKDDETVVLKAGGLDLLDLLKERIINPSLLVNLRSIPGLDTIAYDEKTGLSLGALATLDNIAQSKEVNQHAPCVATAAKSIATPQLRHIATLGGNLCQRPRCWYFRSEDFPCRKKGGTQCYAQDGENVFHALYNNAVCAMVHPSGMAAPLMALQASVTIFSPPHTPPNRQPAPPTLAKPSLRDVSLEDFFLPPEKEMLRENILKPQEILTQIRIPNRPQALRCLYIKEKQKESHDWPLAEIAVAAEIKDKRCHNARVILGAAAPIPWRSKAIEDIINGQILNHDTIERAAKAVQQGARLLAQNAYKIQLFETLTRRALHALANA